MSACLSLNTIVEFTCAGVTCTINNVYFKFFHIHGKKTVFLKGTGETVKLVIMEIKKAYKQLVLAFLYTVAFVQTRLLDML